MSYARGQSVSSAFGRRSGAIQDAEFAVGEGPGVEAYATGAPVLVDDIRAMAGRWPHFVRAVEDLAVRGVYAFPLQMGGVKIGVLVLSRDQGGAFDPDELASTLLVADLMTDLVLAMQTEAASESLAWAFDGADRRVVVHQATGMISAQLNCGVEEALLRLRALSFATVRAIDEVAGDVVAGRLRFDEL